MHPRSFALRSAAAMSILALTATSTHATTVRFETVLGDIDVQLFDTATPQTVANFLAYATGCDYNDTMFHRSATLQNGSPFVLQGGGFNYDGNGETDPNNFQAITSRGDIQNEPGISNTRGTIAMAKLGGNPDSATSEFFFNLGDNAANLDNQNGGFTVFGQVLGDGMDVVDAFAALPTFNFGAGAFGDLPLRDFTDTDVLNKPIDDSNLALIHGIHAIDDNADSSFLSDLELAALDILLTATAAPATAGLDSADSLAGSTPADSQIVQQASASASSATAQIIPEPATATIALASAAAGLTRRKRRNA